MTILYFKFICTYYVERWKQKKHNASQVNHNSVNKNISSSFCQVYLGRWHKNAPSSVQSTYGSKKEHAASRPGSYTDTSQFAIPRQPRQWLAVIHKYDFPRIFFESINESDGQFLLSLYQVIYQVIVFRWIDTVSIICFCLFVSTINHLWFVCKTIADMHPILWCRAHMVNGQRTHQHKAKVAKERVKAKARYRFSIISFKATNKHFIAPFTLYSQ